MISSKMIEVAAGLLRQCDTEETHLAPTIFLNEGWMVRIMTSASIKLGLQLKGIDFGEMPNWYSEGMLSSPFLPLYQGDRLAEGYTHADMALGDFAVDAKAHADIRITGETGSFGIIEAKMKSPLSRGTTHAPGYDQASRNLACIAFNTLKTRHKIFFAVAAPQVTIEKHNIDRIVNKTAMLSRIRKRFESYNDPALLREVKDQIFTKYRSIFQAMDEVLERAAGASLAIVSYEEWLSEFKLLDEELYWEMQDFYRMCKQFNHIE